ncbi:hypothetical protein SXIM_37630 [Streptomyces xiamenensis]|uniref:Uncharacterized protein n=1 Tax=Streptomyces xiamenensis TaxID=408015 RepID=A0A0F7FYB6_9ACTN|nr:hypothetical protein SXIM_37630 [Streptomyces xiamenensis]
MLNHSALACVQYRGVRGQDRIAHQSVRSGGRGVRGHLTDGVRGRDREAHVHSGFSRGVPLGMGSGGGAMGKTLRQSARCAQGNPTPRDGARHGRTECRTVREVPRTDGTGHTADGFDDGSWCL